MNKFRVFLLTSCLILPLLMILLSTGGSCRIKTGIVNECKSLDSGIKKTLFINQLDSSGKKIGLWIENGGLSETYYLNGKKNGVYKSYFKKNKKLAGLGEYKTDEPSGTWYYFDENGHITLIEKDVSVNKKLKVKDNDSGPAGILKYKSIVQIFNKNGIVIEEGIALYDEDIEIDFVRYGKWNYYDNNGRLK